MQNYYSTIPNVFEHCKFNNIKGIFFVFWIYSSIYIFSCGEVKQCNRSPYACIDWQVGVKRSLGFFLFGLFWYNLYNIGIAKSLLRFHNL